MISFFVHIFKIKNVLGCYYKKKTGNSITKNSLRQIFHRKKMSPSFIHNLKRKLSLAALYLSNPLFRTKRNLSIGRTSKKKRPLIENIIFPFVNEKVRKPRWVFLNFHHLGVSSGRPCILLPLREKKQDIQLRKARCAKFFPEKKCFPHLYTISKESCPKGCFLLYKLVV